MFEKVLYRIESKNKTVYQAMAEFAQGFWEKPRKVCNIQKHTFQVVGGTWVYRVSLHPTTNLYEIEVIS